MKCKMFSKWFTRVLLICFLVLVEIGGYCRNPYETNPNLKLLIGDTITWWDSIHCSNPVVSPDGNTIYYLGAPSDSLGVFYDFAVGAVYSVNTNGSNNTKILDGIYGALAISTDGTKLAIHPYENYTYLLPPESLILIINLPNLKVDTFPVPHKWIMDIEFSNNEQALYYSVEIAGYPSKAGIYKLNLLDSTCTFISSFTRLGGFDLLNNDSIYFDNIMVYFQINPSSEKYAIGTSRYFDEKFLLRNMVMDTIFNLPDSLNPYFDGLVGYPYWFPDGDRIVFAAQPYEEGSGAPAGIWILENVFEQIGQ